jgi:secreted trypsin-like serine protease
MVDKQGGCGGGAMIKREIALVLAGGLLMAAQPAPPPMDLPPPPAMDLPPPPMDLPAPPTAAPPASEATDTEAGRVVRGTPALPGSAPWQIQIHTTVKLTPAELARDAGLKDSEPTKNFYAKMDPWEQDHRCGGVLIAPDWALSAAHCFVNRQDRLQPLQSRGVRLGNVDIRHTTPMRIERVIVHGDYRRTGDKRHDIVLIKLLPEPGTDAAIRAQARAASRLTADQRPLATGDDLRVTGWGNTGEREVGALRDKDGQPFRKSPALLEGRLTLVDPKACAAVPSYVKTLNPGVLCVAANDAAASDSCQGDSGGPLMRRGVLIGLVSGGEGCGLRGMPALYTNVAFYADWIAMAQAGSRPGMNARCVVAMRAGRRALVCAG